MYALEFNNENAIKGEDIDMVLDGMAKASALLLTF